MIKVALVMEAIGIGINFARLLSFPSSHAIGAGSTLPVLKCISAVALDAC